MAKLKSAEKELLRHELRHEQETRRDLDQLTDLLAKAARDAASDNRLTEDDRQFLRRQGDIFSTAVSKLIELLAKDQQHAHVREYRLRKLFEALGSTCVIASHQVTDQIKNRLRAAPATAAKKATTEKTNEIIFEVAEMKWRRRPNWTPWGIAGEIHEQVNERLKAQGLKPLGRSAITHRLEKLRSSLFQAAVYLAP